MTDNMQNAIAAFKEAWEQANQSQLKPEGYRTEAGLRAAEPHIRATIAKEIETAQFKVESIHHFHGTECLCGFNSYGRARSATEHITQTLNATQIAQGAPRD